MWKPFVDLLKLIAHAMNVLLLGAGFSRNWGGWLAAEAFEYLLGAPEIVNNEYLREVLWTCQRTGGFEDALAVVRGDNIRNPAPTQNHLLDLNRAVARMFDDMNRGYFSLQEFEFTPSAKTGVRQFLAKFDSIFTLNQDLLLEHHYFVHDVSLISQRRWDGAEMPGMLASGPSVGAGGSKWATRDWVPSVEKFKLGSRIQPYFKLHGSSNWKAALGGPLLILGNDKLRDMSLYPVLNYYFQEFEMQLEAPGTRLMIIGYGFRDKHINDVIERSIAKGLRVFNIGPAGADAEREARRTTESRIPVSSFGEAIKKGLIGASRRGLSEIFGRDAIEYEKVMRFFAR